MKSIQKGAESVVYPAFAELANLTPLSYNINSSNASSIRYHWERTGSMLKKIRLFLLLILMLCVGISCSGSKPTLEEQNAINALSSIQTRLESDISLEAYLGLLNTAKAQMDILKGAPKKNGCFFGAVDKCYAAYEIAGKAWKHKIEAKDENRKNDMGMTLAFSLSFASLNIEKANNCFKR